MYLEEISYSRPDPKDRPGMIGDPYGSLTEIVSICDVDTIHVRYGQENCPCGLYHSFIVRLRDGRTECCDHVRLVDEPDPHTQYGEWIWP